MAERVLVVDDEELIRESLTFMLGREGYDVEEAHHGAEALERMSLRPFDVVITDIEMPEMKGTELLEQISLRYPESFVIIITAYASIETAVEALRHGAYDYIIKPIDFDDLLIRLRRLLDHKRLARENQILRQEIHREYDFGNIVGKSPSMERVFQTIQKVAESEGTVLITGKSGTGKELVARAIHFNSPRRQNRFVAINCGAIVESLFESELFGHKRGSFTGATLDREGYFKLADGGTIFLDEVSEIPYHLQVKLLRAVEQKEVLPVGGTQPLHVDVRIIGATNTSLSERVTQGKFREDLYYRLNVVEIYLPSLAERKDDIPLLVGHFIEKFRAEMGKDVRGVSRDVMNALLNYRWRGEVRELENVIERAMIFCDGCTIEMKYLPESVRNGAAAGDLEPQRGLKDAVQEFERNFILRSLESYGNDKERTAQALGISISSLYRKMQELGMPPERPSGFVPEMPRG
ncbi:MAG: Fis family transcriptional regulator [Ignavibacteriales bacterium CG07_land_8_20_14_0_80_59_12]|nr:MAG: Fis family transcriptional regulator [Ignavibacteriales bacterium CG07_land_8_20_14_0_80_59_12]